MTGKSKERIGAISKDIFSNDYFREANQVILVSPGGLAYCALFIGLEPQARKETGWVFGE